MVSWLPSPDTQLAAHSAGTGGTASGVTSETRRATERGHRRPFVGRLGGRH